MGLNFGRAFPRRGTGTLASGCLNDSQAASRYCTDEALHESSTKTSSARRRPKSPGPTLTALRTSAKPMPRITRS